MIVIQPFTHTRTCHRGLALFTAMTGINSESATRAALPTTERTNVENLSLVVTVLTVLVLFDCFPPG